MNPMNNNTAHNLPNNAVSHIYSIIPNKQLCQYFQLGTTINHCITTIRSNTLSKSNHIVFDSSDNTNHPLIVQCSDLNTTLHFDSITQQCNYIIYTLPADNIHTTLQYKSAVIHSDTTNPTFTHCYHTFGPTHTGIYNSDDNKYTLTYPGIKLIFQCDTNHHSNTTNYTIDSMLKLNYNLSELHIYHGYNAEQRSVPEQSDTDYYNEYVNIHINKGIYLCKHNITIEIQHTSIQDILSDLGEPSHIQYISEQSNKLNIHSPFNVDSNGTTDTTGTLCYTYIQYGIDILFNSLSNVHKIVLRSNLINTVNFGIYNKCNWRIISNNGILLSNDSSILHNDTLAQQLNGTIDTIPNHTISEHKQSDDELFDSLQSPSTTIMDVLQTKQSKKDKKKKQRESGQRTPSQSPPNDSHVPNYPINDTTPSSSATTTNGIQINNKTILTCNDKWSDIESRLTTIKSEPIVHSSHTNDSSHAANPFGSLLLYGIKGLTVSVVSSTQRVDTVTLFSDNSVE